MSIISAIAIYFLIWWVTLFTILPFGVRTQEEDGTVVEGSAGSAPIQPRLLQKAIATTIVSGIIFAAFLTVYHYELISLDDIPFLPRFA